MFTIEETTTWTSEDVLARIRMELPKSWSIRHVCENGWHRAELLDGEGKAQWAGEHADPKILFLDALGWMTFEGRETKHPAWKRRDQEVPLYRPTLDAVSSPAPDPPDVDPDEVAAVYAPKPKP